MKSKLHSSRRFTALLMAAAAALLGAAGPAIAAAKPAAAKPAAAKTDYPKEIAAWQQDRDKGLRAEDGWLTLVGLFWLDEGENKFGSDAQNKVIFPEGRAPGVAGTLLREGKEVQVRVEPGVAVTVDGKELSGSTVLKSDAEKDGPTVLRLGSLSFFVIQRGDRVGVRVKDSKSPALTAFHGLDFFPVQAGWRVDARFEPYKPAKKIKIANILGQVSDEDSPGAVVFNHEGKTYRIDALPGGDKGELFLVFADQTNGKETYGAGRFLDTGAPKDGKVVVDFNTSYNPPCAFTSFATCPLPPAQNRRAGRGPAG